MVDVRKGIRSKTQYSSLTPLERECYEGEVQPYRKTDYKPMIYSVYVGGYGGQIFLQTYQVGGVVGRLIVVFILSISFWCQ